MIVGDSLPVSEAKKCAKFRKALQSKVVHLEKIGDRDNNALVNWLKCEAKVKPSCGEATKAYFACHSSVMGAGTFEGKANCAHELRLLLLCVVD
jgi:hypothetical protein